MPFDLRQSDPAGTRTQGPYIKSVLLYQLSYEIKTSIENVFPKGSANVTIFI